MTIFFSKNFQPTDHKPTLKTISNHKLANKSNHLSLSAFICVHLRLIILKNKREPLDSSLKSSGCIYLAQYIILAPRGQTPFFYFTDKKRAKLALPIIKLRLVIR
jgi:hypothetical protein